MPSPESVLAMMRRLRRMDDCDYLRYLVAYQAAPTVGGIKPASLICPRGGGRCHLDAWRRCRSAIGAALGVHLDGLREASESLMLLVYRPEPLRRALEHPEAKAILIEEGYNPAASRLEPLLGRLREKCGDLQAFPHEIGLFLGYPPRDVRCFMTLGGGCSKATGCWQAYGDLERAECHFARCRAVKEGAASLIGAGAEFEEVANRLLCSA